MDKYKSQNERILLPAKDVYETLTNCNNFTPYVSKFVDNWIADESHISFTYRGLKFAVQTGECIPCSSVKYESTEAAAINFTVIVDLDEPVVGETQMSISLLSNLPLAVKMMIGGKIQGAMNSAVHIFAEALNGNLRGNE